MDSIYLPPSKYSPAKLSFHDNLHLATEHITVNYDNQPLCIQTPSMILSNDKSKKNKLILRFTNLRTDYQATQLLRSVSDIEYQLIHNFSQRQKISYDVALQQCVGSIYIDEDPRIVVNLPNYLNSLTVVDSEYKSIELDEFTNIESLISIFQYAKTILHCKGLTLKNDVYVCEWDVIFIQVFSRYNKLPNSTVSIYEPVADIIYESDDEYIEDILLVI